MAPRLRFGDTVIGSDRPTYVIAEAGINHNGSIQVARELVDIAVEAGADAVKFQKRYLTETYQHDLVENPSQAEMGIEYTLSNLKDVTLTDSEFREIARYCDSQGIGFLCSPWDTSSVDFLETIDLPGYKIGSPDMTNFVLLERLVETGKPLLVSTGMSNEEEIDRTVQFLQEAAVDFALLHCRSTYPSPYRNLNLAFISELGDRYGVPVGYSGHERGIAVSEAAAAMGADIIERHFTKDRTMDGPDHAASLEPTGLSKLVRDIRKIEQSVGTPSRYITRGEYNNRVSLGKSLVVTESVERGESLSRSMLTAKSPAKGISPQELYTVVGSTASRDLDRDEMLQWEDVSDVDLPQYDTDLENWGVVVRYSDIDRHDWGDPDVFEFRINGADIDQNFEVGSYDKRLGVHAPEQVGHDLVDLSALDGDRRRSAVEVIQQVIDKTREELIPAFEVDEPPQIVIHPGGITTDHASFEDVPEMNRSLERSMDELDDGGVELLLENMPPYPWIYGGQRYHNNFMDADEIAAFCDRTGWRICYDTSHAMLWCNSADADLIEHAETLEPYVEYLHVSDAVGHDGEGIQIDEGDIDFGSLMPVFSGFDGPVVTEIWRGHEKRGEGFKKAASRLKSYL